MTVTEAVKNRRSVRTFDGRALDPADAGKIMDFAGQADNPYGISIEWKLLDAKEHGLSSPVIVGTDMYIAGKMRRVPHAEEAFGYSFCAFSVMRFFYSTCQCIKYVFLRDGFEPDPCNEMSRTF